MNREGPLRCIKCKTVYPSTIDYCPKCGFYNIQDTAGAVAFTDFGGGYRGILWRDGVVTWDRPT